MKDKKEYLAPAARILESGCEGVMALSATTGEHTYDEGMDSEEGWIDM